MTDPCALCGGIRPFHDIDRQELEAIVHDVLGFVATIKVNVHARQPHRFIYRDLETIERDMRALRERIFLDGVEIFESDPPPF